MKSIRERIIDALSDGPLPYRELAQRVFPQDDFPRAWNYKHEGGPPGCYMSLSAAIKRYGFQDWTRFRGADDRHGVRMVGLPKGIESPSQ